MAWATSDREVIAARSKVSALNAVMAKGTVCRFSSRFREVTTSSSTPICWARAGPRTTNGPAATDNAIHPAAQSLPAVFSPMAMMIVLPFFP